uniref:Reverse transcriptase domain-containing protein n=1 Tax=Cannabis sativa TaxID=3483 RepID=A0A803QE60_CANSA
MAKTRARQGKQKSEIKKPKKRGPISTADVRKTKTMDAVLGIEPIDFSDGEDGGEDERMRSQDENQLVLSPKSSLQAIQRQEDVSRDFAFFLNANRQCSTNVRQGNSITPPILRSSTVVRNLDSSFKSSEIASKVKITLEDIEDEVQFWKSSIVCYVLGANPPLSVIEGFIRRIWKDKVDKVGSLSYGVFLVRFESVEIRDEILNGGYVFFNNRPLVMKAWDPDVNFKKEDIRSVPIWIQLPELELKYWDEHGFNVFTEIKYEWKPLQCNYCKGLGHTTEDCKKKEGKQQQWVVKDSSKTAISGVEKRNETDSDGFRQVGKGLKVKTKVDVGTTQLTNTYQVLTERNEADQNEAEGQVSVGFADRQGSAGINDHGKQNQVKGMLHANKAGLVGLLETRVKASKLGVLYLNIFKGWCFTSNNAWHDGGRIVVAWNPSSFSVNILKCTSQLIHLQVATLDGKSFFATFVYAFNDIEGRKLLWNDLCSLISLEPWMVMGDFNDILFKEERIGKRVKYLEETEFINCVGSCMLEDVKYGGCLYTWNNKRQGNERICSKIDRVLANQKWLDSFSSAEVIFAAEELFDHTPAIISLSHEILGGKKPFKYFKMWTAHPSYNGIVSGVWNQRIDGSKMYQIVTKLKQLKGAFKELNRQHFANIQNATDEAKKELLETQLKLQSDPLNSDLIATENAVRIKYGQLLKGLNSFLLQKSKVSWIKNGDDNTSIFHASIKERRRANSILSIEDHQGSRTDKADQISAAFIAYYQHLLGTKMEGRKKVNQGVMMLGPLVNKDQADLDNWDLIGEYISEAVISFLHTGQILKEINTTVLTLIPKCKCPNTVSDFRPIACCNVIYKTATKIICSRLKAILPDLIAQNQGGFISGRFIANNIMIFQDLIRHYGRQNAKASCMIKLDLQKASDTLDWDFLEEMLYEFKFPEKFIKLIMICVRTPRFSLMINGSLHGYYEGKWGLRQGDPMSPLLFVFGMEYLSRIMLKIGAKQKFKFHDRCAELKLNHLMFADDVILFSHGDFKSIYYMLQGLKLFSCSSGLQLNPNKSAIYCCGMEDSEMQRILDCSGFNKKEVPFKYLGIPICVKRISGKECMVLADKMTARIKIWSTRNLSLAGRAVLVNSVLMSIHAYWSQVMVLPKRTIRDIEAICRAYLWKGNQVSQGPGPIAWDHVCQPKAAGGIGLKRIAEWNIAAMTKYAWAIAYKEDNLWIKWIQCVYIKGEDWWTYQAPPQASWYWRKLNSVKTQIKGVMDMQQFVSTKYSISNGYKSLCPSQSKVNWSHEVWNRLNIPRHSFCLWITIQDRLRTRERWLERKKMSRFRKAVITAAVATLVYHVWKNRNDLLWNSRRIAQDVVVRAIKEDVKNRVLCNWPKKYKSADADWFALL